jgi:hypothetical protein
MNQAGTRYQVRPNDLDARDEGQSEKRNAKSARKVQKRDKTERKTHPQFGPTGTNRTEGARIEARLQDLLDGRET